MYLSEKRKGGRKIHVGPGFEKAFGADSLFYSKMKKSIQNSFRRHNHIFKCDETIMFSAAIYKQNCILVHLIKEICFGAAICTKILLLLSNGILFFIYKINK